MKKIEFHYNMNYKLRRMSQRIPFSLRISPELAERLAECAKRTKKKKHALAQEAIEAAVEAIEQNNYRLVFPIEFGPKYLPVERVLVERPAEPSKPYEPSEHNFLLAEDSDPKPKKKPAA